MIVLLRLGDTKQRYAYTETNEDTFRKNMGLYTIEVQQLTRCVIIGIHAQEQELAQKINISLKIQCPFRSFSRAETVPPLDYAALVAGIDTLLNDGPFLLLEGLAYHILTFLFHHPETEHATVSLWKDSLIDIPHVTYIPITLSAHRQDFQKQYKSRCCLIRYQAPTDAWAKDLAKKLIRQKLAVCVTQHNASEKHDLWNNECRTESVWPLDIKTSECHVQTIITIIQKKYPDFCPEITVYDIADGHEKYLTLSKESTC